MKSTDLLRAALLKTAANLVPRMPAKLPRAPGAASESFAPTPMVRPPSMSTKMRAFSAPVAPRAPAPPPSASATQAMDFKPAAPVPSKQNLLADLGAGAGSTATLPQPSFLRSARGAMESGGKALWDRLKAGGKDLKNTALNTLPAGAPERIGKALDRMPGGRAPVLTAAGGTTAGALGGATAAKLVPEAPEIPAAPPMPMAGPEAAPAPAPVAPASTPSATPFMDVPRGPYRDPAEGVMA